MSRARQKIIEAVESRGYTVHDLEWEPWGRAAEKEGIPGGWTFRVEPDPSPPGSTGYGWFGGLSWRETVENIERWLPARADSQPEASGEAGTVTRSAGSKEPT